MKPRYLFLTLPFGIGIFSFLLKELSIPRARPGIWLLSLILIWEAPGHHIPRVHTDWRGVYRFLEANAPRGSRAIIYSISDKPSNYITTYFIGKSVYASPVLSMRVQMLDWGEQIFPQGIVSLLDQGLQAGGLLFIVDPHTKPVDRAVPFAAEGIYEEQFEGIRVFTFPDAFPSPARAIYTFLKGFDLKGVAERNLVWHRFLLVHAAARLRLCNEAERELFMISAYHSLPMESSASSIFNRMCLNGG